MLIRRRPSSPILVFRPSVIRVPPWLMQLPPPKLKKKLGLVVIQTFNKSFKLTAHPRPMGILSFARPILLPLCRENSKVLLIFKFITGTANLVTGLTKKLAEPLPPFPHLLL